MILPRRLFVVAAHPDDDTIGCGATMALVAHAGGSVSVAYLTDGSRSHPGSRRFPPERVAALRAAEARVSLEILGVRDEPEFFGVEDGSLHALGDAERSAIVARLTQAIVAFAPEVVLAPWIRDPHPDHIAAAALTASALELLDPRPASFAYEVWLPIRGSAEDRPRAHEATPHAIALDDSLRERKRRAILAHATQTSGLIDDDPDGFLIDDALVSRWTGRTEILHEWRVEEVHAR